MYNEFYNSIKRNYLMNIPVITEELTKLNNAYKPKETYVPYCLKIIETFFSEMGKDEIKKLKNYSEVEIIKYITIVSFWIVDKYIEDESLLLYELVKYDGSLNRIKVLDFEVILFNKVNKLRNFIDKNL